MHGAPKLLLPDRWHKPRVGNLGGVHAASDLFMVALTHSNSACLRWECFFSRLNSWRNTTSVQPAYCRSDEVEQRRGVHAKPYEQNCESAEDKNAATPESLHRKLTFRRCSDQYFGAPMRRPFHFVRVPPRRGST